MAIKVAKPAGKTVAKKVAAAKKAAPARRRYEDDEEDETEQPRARRRRDDDEGDDEPPAPPARTNRRGWGSAEHVKETSYTKRFAKALKVEANQTVVFKFMEDEPYDSIKIHWIEKKGKKSYVCPETDDCPLCAADVEVKFEARFNVALLTDVDPILRSFNVSGRRYDEVRAYGSAANTKPLTRKWYSLSRTGSEWNNTRYKLDVIRRAADIEEDFPDLHVPTEDELGALELYDESTTDAERPSMKELKEVAADLLSGGYDDD